jgi:hypothetical protein
MAFTYFFTGAHRQQAVKGDLIPISQEIGMQL